MKTCYNFLIWIVLISSNYIINAQNIQPEYTSFESVSSTDMVNLITGDFTLNLPILEVPGPEGGFSTSLAYHAGIKNNQEASWVGLGWNLNCGAIARSLSYFPDDFEGQVITTSLVNQGVKSWVKSWIQYSTYYNSQKGRLGQTIGIPDFNITWGKYLDTKVNYTRAGVTVNYSERKRDHSPFSSRNGVTLDGEQLAISIVSTAISILSYGSSETAKTTSDQILGALRTLKTAYDLYQTYTNLSNLFTDFSTSRGLWETHDKPAKLFSHGTIIYRESETYLNTGIPEKAYGTLNLDKVTTQQNPNHDVFVGYNQSGGIAEIYSGTHDYNMYVDESSDYQWNMNPVSLAYDRYTVMGDGVAGNITPYRFDIGSVATSSFGDLGSYKPFQVIPYVSNAKKFLYTSDIGNKYLHHLGAGQNIDITDDELDDQYGFTWETPGPSNTLAGISFFIGDANIYSARTENNNREGYRYDNTTKNMDLSTGRYITYLTNGEIVDSYNNPSFNGFKGGFCDYSDFNFATNASRKQFRIDAVYENSTFYANGIAGFCITNESGFTFHFSLPIYNLTSTTVTNNAGTTSTVVVPNNYAIAWLLTGITGPDFVDRGTKGIIDEADWGYWVKFTYKKWLESYYQRTPSSGVIYSADNNTNTYTETTSQIYYLESIQTKTHAALFIKGNRKDGVNLLRLNDIIVLNISDLNYLKNQYSSLTISNYCSGSTNNDIKNYLKTKQLKRISFKYDENYPLCTGTPTNTTGMGRLTLKYLQTFLKNDVKILPGYTFYYDSPNPSYGVNNWDGWGMFSNTTNHGVENDQGNKWCLNKVLNPDGSRIDISYERDDYTSVSGYSIPLKKGGDNRVSELRVTDGLGKIYSTKYIYTSDGIQGSGNSTGSCSLEPEYNRSNIELYTLTKKTQMLDYPITPVLYGKVTVLSEFNGTSYLAKKVFEFETPKAEMLNVRPKTIYDDRFYHFENSNRYAKLMNYVIEINTDKIGALNKISRFYNDNLLSTEEYSYINSHNQDGGIYTEGTIMLDRCVWDSETESAVRLFRTTKIHYPNILKSIVYKDQLGTKTITNENFDFVTGGVVANTITSNTKSNKTVTIPAYKVYNGMGPKYLDINNKNMLIQTAATYNYANVGTISEPNWNPFNVEIQTWKNSWTDIFDNNIISNSVWRAFKTFEWKGPLDNNGCYNSTAFNSTGIYSPTNIVIPSNWNDFDLDGENGWMKTSEITLHNTNSLPLENKDINGNFSALKTDLTSKFIFASASFARYEEIAYSGAEEVVAVNAKFGGNVLNVSGTCATTFAHTGLRSLLVSSGNKGFSYTGTMLSRKYRISVWAKGNASDYNKVKIGYKIGGSDFIASNRREFQADNWFLVTGETDNVGGSTEFYCQANGGSMYFDDFRVQPCDAIMNTYVYDERGNQIAILDNENIAMVSSYDNADRLISSFKETITGISKLSDISYNSSGCLCSPNFAWSPYVATNGARIDFINSEDDANCTYQWSFGSSIKNPSYSFDVPGTSSNGYYLVTCTVTDAKNNSTSETKRLFVPYVQISFPYARPINLSSENVIRFYGSTPGTYLIEQIYNGSVMRSTTLSTSSYEKTHELKDWIIKPGGTNICSFRVSISNVSSIIENVQLL